MPDDKKAAKTDAGKVVPGPDPADAAKPAAFPVSGTSAPAPQPAPPVQLDSRVDDKKGGTLPRPKRATEPPATRVCHESERATPGLTRFRVRAVDHDRPIGQYILAPDQAAAEACYLKHERFAELDEPDRPALRVDELPD